MSRSLTKNDRVYIDGYDMSGYARTIGPLKWTFDEAVDDAMSASLKGAWCGQAITGCGTLNALFDNTATVGTHARLAGAGVKRIVLVAKGMEAAPVKYIPAYCGQFIQSDYPVEASANPTAVSIKLDTPYIGIYNLMYASPWGVLLHENKAETGVNSTEYHDALAASACGGFMCYQVLTAAGTGDITAAIKVQDSTTTTSGDFTDLLTSGTINCGSGGVAVPTSGLIALSPTATVKRYTRWQIVLTTATSVTFVLAFCRNPHN